MILFLNISKFLKGKSKILTWSSNEIQENLKEIGTPNPDCLVNKPLDPDSLSNNQSNEQLSGSSEVLEAHSSIKLPVVHSEPGCTACSNGHEPGNHKCVIFRSYVHALDNECSMPFGEEGHGQDRICMTCFKAGNLHNIQESRNFVNWKNAAVKNNQIDEKMKQALKRKDSDVGTPCKKKGKQSFYASKNNASTIKDKLEIEKHKKVPLIKNGNCSKATIKIDGLPTALQNTCGVDSLFQIILNGSYDFPEIKLLVSIFFKNAQNLCTYFFVNKLIDKSYELIIL